MPVARFFSMCFGQAASRSPEAGAELESDASKGPAQQDAAPLGLLPLITHAMASAATGSGEFPPKYTPSRPASTLPSSGTTNAAAQRQQDQALSLPHWPHQLLHQPCTPTSIQRRISGAPGPAPGTFAGLRYTQSMNTLTSPDLFASGSHPILTRSISQPDNLASVLSALPRVRAPRPGTSAVANLDEATQVVTPAIAAWLPHHGAPGTATPTHPPSTPLHAHHHGVITGVGLGAVMAELDQGIEYPTTPSPADNLFLTSVNDEAPGSAHSWGSAITS